MLVGGGSVGMEEGGAPVEEDVGRAADPDEYHLREGQERRKGREATAGGRMMQGGGGYPGELGKRSL